MYIGHHIEVKFWDFDKSRVKKSHPNSIRLNNLIVKKIAEVDDVLLQAEVRKEHIDLQELKKRFPIGNRQPMLLNMCLHNRGFIYFLTYFCSPPYITPIESL